MGIERKNIHHAAQKGKGSQVHGNGRTCFPLNSVSSFPCTYCRNVVREEREEEETTKSRSLGEKGSKSKRSEMRN